MEIQKVLCYVAMIVAGLVCLIFLLDATLSILGRNLVLDILFIRRAVRDSLRRTVTRFGHERRAEVTRS